MADYLTIPFNKAAFKASHNSYQADINLHAQLRWDANNPWRAGCRGVELDIWRHSDDSGGKAVHYFTVAHSTPGNDPLAAYLGYLLSFHVNHPGHDPIMVMIDIKSTGGSRKKFPAEFDAYLREWFDASLIYTPGALVKFPDGEMLSRVKDGAWPTVGELRDKFIFCLTGNEDWKGWYADHADAQSLCFADYEFPNDKKLSKFRSKLPTNRVVLNFEASVGDYDTWKPVTEALSDMGYFIRAYGVNSEKLWTRARRAKVNMVATNEVRGEAWSCVGLEPFVDVSAE